MHVKMVSRVLGTSRHLIFFLGKLSKIVSGYLKLSTMIEMEPGSEFRILVMKYIGFYLPFFGPRKRVLPVYNFSLCSID